MNRTALHQSPLWQSIKSTPESALGPQARTAEVIEFAVRPDRHCDDSVYQAREAGPGEQEKLTLKSWVAIVDWRGPFESEAAGTDANYAALKRASDYAAETWNTNYLSYGVYAAVGHLKSWWAPWLKRKLLYIGSGGDVSGRIKTSENLRLIKGRDTAYWVGFIRGPLIEPQIDSRTIRWWMFTERSLIYACNPLLNKNEHLDRPPFDFHITNRVFPIGDARGARRFRRLMPFTVELRKKDTPQGLSLKLEWCDGNEKTVRLLEESPAPEQRDKTYRERASERYVWQPWHKETISDAVSPIVGKRTASLVPYAAAIALIAGVLTAAVLHFEGRNVEGPTTRVATQEPRSEAMIRTQKEFDVATRPLGEAAQRVELKVLKHDVYKIAEEATGRIQQATATLNSVFEKFSKDNSPPSPAPPATVTVIKSITPKYFIVDGSQHCMRAATSEAEVVCMVMTEGEERVVPIGKPSWEVRKTIEQYEGP